MKYRPRSVSFSEANKYEGLPTLVVEILSPSTKGKDMVTKLNLYIKSGVLEYWFADIETRSIIQYSFSQERDIECLNSFKEGETVRSNVFEGLEIPVKDIFTL